MGSVLSTLVYQPLILSTAITLMIVALIYQYATCNPKRNNANNATPTQPGYGSELFKLNVGIATALVIIAIIIGLLVFIFG
jgi:archaellum biogenesis protein FlaJ (TadC family)